MNIIRTKVVELSILPAVAYKLKLKTGGSGIKLHRTDRDAAAFAEVDKRTGGIVQGSDVDFSVFPEEAFDEAIEMLAGLPYSARGKVKIMIDEDVAENEVKESEVLNVTAACMVASDEFAAIVDRYSDEGGKLNYTLMNKQFIQFAASSKVVGELVAKRVHENEILLFVLKNRGAFLAGKREHINDEEAAALREALDEINPRSAFKELSQHIRRMLGR